MADIEERPRSSRRRARCCPWGLRCPSRRRRVGRPTARPSQPARSVPRHARRHRVLLPRPRPCPVGPVDDRLAMGPPQLRAHRAGHGHHDGVVGARGVAVPGGRRTDPRLVAGRTRPRARAPVAPSDVPGRGRPRSLDRGHPPLRQRMAGHGWSSLDPSGPRARWRRRLRLGLDALRDLLLDPPGRTGALPRARARLHAAQPAGHRLGDRRIFQDRAPPHPPTRRAPFRAVDRGSRPPCPWASSSPVPRSGWSRVGPDRGTSSTSAPST